MWVAQIGFSGIFWIWHKVIRDWWSGAICEELGKGVESKDDQNVFHVCMNEIFKELRNILLKWKN